MNAKFKSYSIRGDVKIPPLRSSSRIASRNFREIFNGLTAWEGLKQLLKRSPRQCLDGTDATNHSHRQFLFAENQSQMFNP